MLDFHDTFPPEVGKVSLTPDVLTDRSANDYARLGSEVASAVMAQSLGLTDERVTNAFDVAYSLTPQLGFFEGVSFTSGIQDGIISQLETEKRTNSEVTLL